MKNVWLGSLVAGLVVCFAGCLPSSKSDSLFVSFEKDVPVSYKMISERHTKIDLTDADPSKKSRPQTTQEKLELVMVYTPLAVEQFGVTTLKADCQSVRAQRSGFSGKVEKKDAIEKLAGKSFILKVSPTGQIVDHSDLERVAAEVANASFESGRSGMRIKNPEMINDFLAMQQFLWDAAASSFNQSDHIPSEPWQSQQTIAWPTPMYPPPSRITTYTLDGISEEPPRMASISSAYAVSETPIESYVRPYDEGRFQMRGLFGFLRNYRFKKIEGSGKQIFNLDTGLVESDHQQYTLEVTANFMLPLGNSLPILTVDQSFSVELIQSPE